MNNENNITPFPEQILLTQVGSGSIPPRRRIPTACGLVDDIPEVFRKAFTKEDLDPTITIVKTQRQAFRELNLGTLYLFHHTLYEK